MPCRFRPYLLVYTACRACSHIDCSRSEVVQCLMHADFQQTHAMLILVEHSTCTHSWRMHQWQERRLLGLPVPRPHGLQYRHTTL